mgnify:CR=1 FL=1
MSGTDSPGPRERIISTAYDLFTRRGVGDVGVDEVAHKAGVAKATLYRHFPSKNDLVLAFLEHREELWTIRVIDQLPAQRCPGDPAGQLVALFDILDDWFHSRHDYEACSFIKVHFEVGGDGEVGHACLRHLEKIRHILKARAEQAGLRDSAELAWKLNILIKGSIVNAAEGDLDSAARAKLLARWLVEQHTT